MSPYAWVSRRRFSKDHRPTAITPVGPGHAPPPRMPLLARADEVIG